MYRSFSLRRSCPTFISFREEWALAPAYLTFSPNSSNHWGVVSFAPDRGPSLRIHGLIVEPRRQECKEECWQQRITRIKRALGSDSWHSCHSWFKKKYPQIAQPGLRPEPNQRAQGRRGAERKTQLHSILPQRHCVSARDIIRFSIRTCLARSELSGNGFELLRVSSTDSEWVSLRKSAKSADDLLAMYRQARPGVMHETVAASCPGPDPSTALGMTKGRVVRGRATYRTTDHSRGRLCYISLRAFLSPCGARVQETGGRDILWRFLLTGEYG